MSAWAGIAAIYNYKPDIFDGVSLPTIDELRSRDKVEYIDDIQPLSRDTLIDNIIFELAELELLYPDPDFLKNMIELWCRVERENWLSMWETMLYKYNPIWNKDGEIIEDRSASREGSASELKEGTSGNVRTLGTVRTSEQTETGQNTQTGTHSLNRTETEGGTIADAGSSIAQTTKTAQGSGNKTVAHNVTGFNTNSYSPDTQDVENASNNSTETSSGTGTENNTRTLDTEKDTVESGQTGQSGTDSRTGQGTVRDSGTIEDSGNTSSTGSSTSSGSEQESTRRIERGNIGVTMTQDMIDRQRAVVEFNLYKYITNSFKRRFCVMVY